MVDCPPSIWLGAHSSESTSLQPVRLASRPLTSQQPWAARAQSTQQGLLCSSGVSGSHRGEKWCCTYPDKVAWTWITEIPTGRLDQGVPAHRMEEHPDGYLKLQARSPRALQSPKTSSKPPRTTTPDFCTETQPPDASSWPQTLAIGEKTTLGGFLVLKLCFAPHQNASKQG